MRMRPAHTRPYTPQLARTCTRRHTSSVHADCLVTAASATCSDCCVAWWACMHASACCVSSWQSHAQAGRPSSASAEVLLGLLHPGLTRGQVQHQHQHQQPHWRCTAEGVPSWGQPLRTCCCRQHGPRSACLPCCFSSCYASMPAARSRRVAAWAQPCTGIAMAACGSADAAAACFSLHGAPPPQCGLNAGTALRAAAPDALRGAECGPGRCASTMPRCGAAPSLHPPAVPVHACIRCLFMLPQCTVSGQARPAIAPANPPPVLRPRSSSQLSLIGPCNYCACDPPRRFRYL